MSKVYVVGAGMTKMAGRHFDATYWKLAQMGGRALLEKMPGDFHLGQVSFASFGIYNDMFEGHAIPETFLNDVLGLHLKEFDRVTTGGQTGMAALTRTHDALAGGETSTGPGLRRGEGAGQLRPADQEHDPHGGRHHRLLVALLDAVAARGHRLLQLRADHQRLSPGLSQGPRARRPLQVHRADVQKRRAQRPGPALPREGHCRAGARLAHHHQRHPPRRSLRVLRGGGGRAPGRGSPGPRDVPGHQAADDPGGRHRPCRRVHLRRPRLPAPERAPHRVGQGGHRARLRHGWHRTRPGRGGRASTAPSDRRGSSRWP